MIHEILEDIAGDVIEDIIDFVIDIAGAAIKSKKSKRRR